MRLIDNDPDDSPPQINIVPMIDVIFAILTFFVMSSLFLTQNEGLPVNLPQAATTQTQSESQITVTIDQKGQLALNRQSIGLNALQSRVRGLVGANREALVVINADERVSHGQVVSVMDQLRAVKGVKLAIATTKP